MAAAPDHHFLLLENEHVRVLDLADHAYLIETGRVVLSGTAHEVKNNDAVRAPTARAPSAEGSS